MLGWQLTWRLRTPCPCMPGNGDKEIPLKILNSHNPLAPLPLQEILHRLCPL